MQVSLRHFGEIKIDNDVDRLNINSPGEQVGANQIPAATLSEIVEHFVPVLLKDRLSLL